MITISPPPPPPPLLPLLLIIIIITIIIHSYKTSPATVLNPWSTPGGFWGTPSGGGVWQMPFFFVIFHVKLKQTFNLVHFLFMALLEPCLQFKKKTNHFKYFWNCIENKFWETREYRNSNGTALGEEERLRLLDNACSLKKLWWINRRLWETFTRVSWRKMTPWKINRW